jgi:hypothetical protein
MPSLDAKALHRLKRGRVESCDSGVYVRNGYHSLKVSQIFSAKAEDIDCDNNHADIGLGCEVPRQYLGQPVPTRNFIRVR